MRHTRTSLVVQRLRGRVLIPSWGTKIPDHAAWCGKKMKKNFFKFKKKGPHTGIWALLATHVGRITLTAAETDSSHHGA